MLQQEDCFALPTDALERQRQGRKTALRDIHTLVDLPQHVAFRLVRGLELGRLIDVGACLHDAFSAELELTDACTTLVTRILANG